MSRYSAMRALRALTEFSDDAAINAALEAFARDAHRLSPAEIATVTCEAIACIADARPEWLMSECEAAVTCVLREVERVRRARRRVA